MYNDEQAADFIAQFIRNQVNVKRNLPIRSSDMGIMMYLSHHQEAKAKDISDFFVIAGATVTEMIQRLEKSGMIAIRQDEHDGRVKRIQLSDQGIRYVEETRMDYLESIQSIRQTLGDEDFERFISCVHRVNESRAKR